MKDKLVKFRLTEELYNTLLIKASSSNKTVSEYMRESILNTNIKFDNSDNILSLIFQLKQIGNNLNQIAHNLNTANLKNELSDIKYDDLLNTLLSIEYSINEISHEYI